MAETFLNVVNEVLDSIGEPILTSTNFANAVQKQARVKRLVCRVYKSLQIHLPDEHLHATEDILLNAPKNFPGGDGIGIEQLSIGGGSVIQLGGVTNINLAPEGYRAFGAVGNAQNANVVIQIDTNDDHGAIDHSQWYRIDRLGSATVIILTSEHLLGQVSATGIVNALTPNRLSFRLAAFRVSLPSDFQDVVDVDRPFGSNVNVQPMDVNELTARIYASGGAYTSQHPTNYAVAWDTDPTGGTRIGPFLWFYPFPASDRYYRLQYKRHLTSITEASAHDVVFDLPLEMIPSLIYTSVTRAKVDIANQAEGAGVYDKLAERQTKDLKDREITKVATATLEPDMGAYRGHYRKGRGRQIWIEGE